MAKWLFTYAGKAVVKWRFVEFGGKTGSESRGIVDFIAIRKHHQQIDGLKRGDLFDLILIQTKGGSAAHPTDEDAGRLNKVREYHRAKEVLLVEWNRRKSLKVFRLEGLVWEPIDRSGLAEVFR
jgi:hypothetical protein